MVDSSVTYRPSTLPEAARILGVSESTVRRPVKAGKLEAERVLRPPGHVWMVQVPEPSTDPPGDPPQLVGAPPANPSGQPAAPPALTVWMAGVLEPLMTEMSLSRQQLVSQAEAIGALGAESAALHAVECPQEPQPAPEPDEAATETLAPMPPPRVPEPNGIAPAGHVAPRWRAWLGGLGRC